MMVIKIGGSVICKDVSSVVRNLPKHASSAVVVHGGGCLVNKVMRRMGIEPKYLTHPGGVTSRYTDLESLRAFLMAMMWINKQLVASLHAMGVDALGLSGADMGVVRARRKERVIIIDERGRQRVVDGGYSGRILHVDAAKLAPPPLKVLAPVAVSDRGELLNVDGDQLALEIAKSLRAERLVILSDVDGIIIGGRVVARLTAREAEELSRSEEVRGGMKRKLLVAAEAARLGVEVTISSGLVENPIDAAIAGSGTHIISG